MKLSDGLRGSKIAARSQLKLGGNTLQNNLTRDI